MLLRVSSHAFVDTTGRKYKSLEWEYEDQTVLLFTFRVVYLILVRRQQPVLLDAMCCLYTGRVAMRFVCTWWTVFVCFNHIFVQIEQRLRSEVN